MADRIKHDPRHAHRRGRPEISWLRPKNLATDRSAIRSLQERAKELKCIYAVDEILARESTTAEEAFASVIAVIPAGWQYPAACQARITWKGLIFASPGYVETEWRQCAPIHEGQTEMGEIEVSYTGNMPEADIGPFLNEESRLITTIADRLSAFLKQKATGENG